MSESHLLRVLSLYYRGREEASEMGLRNRDEERDTSEREERFERLRRIGEWVKGQREPEPLIEGQKDEA